MFSRIVLWLRRLRHDRLVRRTAKATRKGAYTAAALLAACGLGSCATTTAATALVAGQVGVDAYCAMHPAARAEVRRKLRINTPILCPDDYVVVR